MSEEFTGDVVLARLPRNRQSQNRDEGMVGAQLKLAKESLSTCEVIPPLGFQVVQPGYLNASGSPVVFHNYGNKQLLETGPSNAARPTRSAKSDTKNLT